jgi:peptide/nickel transport system permease protein
MLIRRVLLGGVTVCIVSLIIFAGVEMLPGDACTQFLGEYQADEELLAQCRKDLDLNRPPIDRFAEWTQGAITGDLGLAADGTTKISTIVGDRLKNSLLLAFCAMAVGIPLALLLGVVSGLWRDRLPDIIAVNSGYFCHDHSRICFGNITYSCAQRLAWLAARHCPDLGSGTGKRILSLKFCCR